MRAGDILPDNKEQTLPVMESFYTIQGEGYYQGRAAWFIRLGGCDVGCVWCDVIESWDAEAHPRFTIREIVAKATEVPCRLAVITGGEPTLYDLAELTRQLHENGFQTNIETSGAHELTGDFDWVCLSPKKFKSPVESVLQKADELKIIIYNKSDFNWGESFAAKMRKDCRLFLQPEWSRAEQMTPLIVDYIKKNPGWELSLQIHKYINVP